PSRVLSRPCPAEREFPIGPARTRASDGRVHELRPEMQYVPAVRLNHVGLRVPLALRIPRVRIADDGAEGFQIKTRRIVGGDGGRPWDDHSEIGRGQPSRTGTVRQELRESSER